MKIALNNTSIVTRSTPSVASPTKAIVNDTLVSLATAIKKTKSSAVAAVTAVDLKKNKGLPTGGQNTRRTSNGVALLATAAAAVAFSGPTDRNVFSFSSEAATATLSLVSNINKLPLAAPSCDTKSKASNVVASKNTTTTNCNSNLNNSIIAPSTNNAKAVVGPPTPTTITTTTTVSNKSQHFQIPSDILDDLASRFIINVPDVERTNLIRICFQIELAHWFYLDFFCAIEEKKLQSCGIKQFAMQLFQHIPFLRKHLSTIDKILDDWKNYKLAVPTYGAILISKDLNFVLLVQSYWAKSSWGFPKGKVNENEKPEHCATREVYEETGYDITGLIVPNDYIEAVINYQYTRLYIVRNVSLDTHFSPRTRNEIKCCDWFPIDSLPINKNDAISKTNLGINANSFFMIMPFVKRLKKWLNDNRSGIETRRKFPSSSSPIMTFNNGNGNNSCGIGQKNNNNYNNNNSSKKDEKKDVASTNNNNSSRNTNKRQRHKSMGDLDGIKYNLSNNDNNINSSSSNVKSSGGTKTSSSSTSSSTTTSVAVSKTISSSLSNQFSTPISSGVLLVGSMTTGNGKRIDKHSKMNNNSLGGGGNMPPKRQLFHSNSQNGSSSNNTPIANQFSDDFKSLVGGNKGINIVSSFDLIRKEKNQQRSSAANVEARGNNKSSSKSTTNGGSTNRTRAKSQSCAGQQTVGTNTQSKVNSGGQQQQQHQQQATPKGNSSGKQHANQNLKKQQAMIPMSSSTGYITPPPISGSGLIAVAKAAVATPQQADHDIFSQQQQSKQKHRSKVVSDKISTEQLQRMLSNTNLKTQPSSSIGLMKSASVENGTSHTATVATTEQILKFNPNFDSWTNFSFTKNFIANVFC